MTLGTNTVLSVKLLQLISTSFSFHVLGGGKYTYLCKIILACLSSFLPCHLFHTAQTIISQQNGKKLRCDSSQLSPKSVLTTFLLYPILILEHLQIQVADTGLQSCGIQRGTEWLSKTGDRPINSLSWQYKVWLPQLSQNFNPTETTAESSYFCFY